MLATAPGPHVIEVELQGQVPGLPPHGERTAFQVAAVGAEGGFLPGYSAWIPDTGHDWVKFNLTATVPVPYRVVATGRLVEEATDNKVYRASFASENPTEMPSVFVGPYVTAERREKGLRIRTYFHPELASIADAYLKASASFIHRYSNRIGPYAHGDFHVVSAPFPVGWGFPNLTYVGRRVLPLPFMRGRSLAHEILHGWWGNGVAVDSTSGNWAEGLTSYLADYDLARELGSMVAREMRLGWLQNFAALPRNQQMPVERFIFKRHDAAQVVGYDKVAFIFHMLEAELGRASFDAGLQRFWKKHRFTRAAWSDLQAAFEIASGRDLRWFFDQWLTRPAAPRIELVRAERGGSDGSYRVVLRIRQARPVYRVRLPVVIETGRGVIRREVQLTREEQTFALESVDKPLALGVDPDFGVFRMLLPAENPPIIRDVTLSRKTVLLLPTDSHGIALHARRLAQRLLQREPDIREGDPEGLGKVPVIAIGIDKYIAALRARMGPFSHTAEVADGVANLGTARAWVERRFDGAPWLFVAAKDVASLEAVLRPLPHYRRRSFIIFEGAKAVKQGMWRAQDSPLTVRFGE